MGLNKTEQKIFDKEVRLTDKVLEKLSFEEIQIIDEHYKADFALEMIRRMDSIQLLVLLKAVIKDRIEDLK